MRLFVNLVLLSAAVLILGGDVAFARDLVGAARTAQAQFTSIGVAGLGIGVTLGGILFVIGLAHVGRMVLVGALIGAVCILGGPAIISLLTKIFA